MLPSTNRSIILLFLLALLMQLISSYYWEIFPPEPLYGEEEISSIKEAWEEEDRRAEMQFRENIKSFDPNAADSSFLASIGLNRSLIKSWQNYTAKGARFYKKEDLLRLYQMDSAIYLRLEAYIEIPERKYPSKWPGQAEKRFLKLQTFNPNEVDSLEMALMGIPERARKGIISFRKNYRPFELKQDIYKVFGIDSSLAEKLYPFIDLPEHGDPVLDNVDFNSADSATLVRLAGIGANRAQRIIDWRIRLGGYHSFDQLLDHHLVDSIFLDNNKAIISIKGPLKQLDLNQANLKELQSHPYINYYVARNIIDFREQVRAFKSVDELANIELVDDVLFSKLAPYLKVSSKGTNAQNLSN